MERRFEVRLERLMDDAVLNPEVFRGMLGRLERFVDPFVERLKRCEQRQHAWEYIAGLLSDVERKNAESIAYHFPRRAMTRWRWIVNGAGVWGRLTIAR